MASLPWNTIPLLRTAAIFTGLSGALSLLQPGFVAATAGLAAIALGAALANRTPRGTRLERVSVPAWYRYLPFAVAGVGWLAFLSLTPVVPPGPRAGILAGSVLFLWWLDRGGPETSGAA